jgi:hypothetical protein
LDMRAGFDEGGDEVVAVTLGVYVHRVEIVLDMP